MGEKTRKDRVNEILTQITACNKAKYRKEEVLHELLELQKQLVQLVFDEKHAECSSYRIKDVQSHLEKMNQGAGNIMDSELTEVLDGCDVINNLIASEFSGQTGERKAFRSLETVSCPYSLLKNVELKYGQHKSELDAIMFTSKGVFIIEVKNSKRDIQIDNHGNFYRIGRSKSFDKNIAERMNEKSFLVRNILMEAEIAAPCIKNIVVFTNNTIQVNNQYPRISTCFLGELPHIIEEGAEEDIYTYADIEHMKERIHVARCQEEYPLELDMNQFKIDFATLLASLEMKLADDDKLLAEKEERVESSENSESTFLAKNSKKIAGSLSLSMVLACATMAVSLCRKKHRK